MTKRAPGTPQGPAGIGEDQGLSQNRRQEWGSRIPTTSPGSSPKPAAPAKQGRACTGAQLLPAAALGSSHHHRHGSVTATSPAEPWLCPQGSSAPPDTGWDQRPQPHCLLAQVGSIAPARKPSS